MRVTVPIVCLFALWALALTLMFSDDSWRNFPHPVAHTLAGGK